MTTAAENQFDVFLSYQSDDRPWVNGLKQALEAKPHELKVWFDQDQVLPGAPFVARLERGIVSSRCTVVVVSARSAASQWVAEEYALALQLSHGEQGRVVIPVLMDGSKPTGFLASRSYVDFAAFASFGAAVEALVKGVKRVKGEAAPSLSTASSSRAVAFDSRVFLQKSQVNAEQKLARQERARATLLLLCMAVGALLFAAVYLAALPRPLYLGGAVPVLLAWGLSESQLTRLRSRIDREGTLLAAVEGCNGSELENCRRIRDEVWRLAFEAAGVREAT